MRRFLPFGSVIAAVLYGCAGGGSTTITFAVGQGEAENVAGEIRHWGADADTLQYDVRKSPPLQLAGLNSSVTHIFYFATNPISRTKPALVSRSILEDFIAFYVQGFHDLCMHMTRNRNQRVPGGAKLLFYYPSSEFVEERPAGMTEYAMAKAAGEQMCRDLNLYVPGLRILVSRLPRLRTDQTLSLLPEHETDPIEVMLPIVREMMALAAET